ncbi:TetR/AcrR family transcriptional regulator [Nocardioides dongkuii]|uniref:TetR/AcrR family transcriptional regulator n=1 Tax=Nocardioides dongkuii TaxID=2760089 RepID=UPI0015FA9C77|nr:WHG domain-containing protein [Nocardioides dongkuii]
MGTTQEPTRRERQREATYDEIVRASRALLADGAELSLRAVAGRMGMTAPALYRYVASYQELVDLVAFEIDKAATAVFAAAADELPEDDHAGRLCVSVTEFRQWALASPREFGLVFANPIADAGCTRRELLTVATSGHLFTGQLRRLWESNQHPLPALDDLPPPVLEAVLDPLIPAETDTIPREHRGLVWVFMQGWTRLYGVVALEVFGHMDPRIIESGEMFVDVVRGYAPVIGVQDDFPRLEALIRARLAR